jgi:hypothetical protein
MSLLEDDEWMVEKEARAPSPEILAGRTVANK